MCKSDQRIKKKTDTDNRVKCPFSLEKINGAKEKHQGGENPPEDRYGEFGNNLPVTGFIFQPEHGQKCGQGHGGNKPSQVGEAFGYFADKRNYKSGNNNFYYKKHNHFPPDYS
jgi:hypothetical protein